MFCPTHNNMEEAMSAQRSESAKASTATSTTSSSGRKPWKKKTPVEIVLDQVARLKREILDEERSLTEKKRQLAKFEEAKKLFEG
jgi:hypothetical protein